MTLREIVGVLSIDYMGNFSIILTQCIHIEAETRLNFRPYLLNNYFVIDG